MKVKIDKLDYFGRGIANTPKKVFVRDAHIGETLDIKITKMHKTYDEGIIKSILESKKRIESQCPYYPACGGCDLRSYEYNDTINYKLNNVKEILKDYINSDTLINIYKSKSFMRNKVVFKVKNSKIGFYEKKTHDLIEIKLCFNIKPSINKIIPYLNSLNIINGEILVRTNYTDELLVSIKTKDKVDTTVLESFPNIKGIILNDKTIYKDNYFYDKIDSYIFKVSYNSFFQVNSYINGKIFNLLKMELGKDKNVLDLCSGVGTLSTLASSFSKKVYGIEINKNSYQDSLENIKLNGIKNCNFINGDAFKLMNDINDKIDTIIIDPPRSGISKKGINSILNYNFNKLIYISCNPITLKRDLSYLKEKYKLNKLYILDMFPYTYHVESFCVLDRKN